MKDLLGEFSENYEDVHSVEEEESNTSKIYRGFNKKDNREICLKVRDKKQIELGDKDFILEQIEKEEVLTKKCKSDNIIEFYRRFETPNNIIFELEYCEQNIMDYLKENGELRREPENFKQLVLSLANALLVIHSNGIMHRDIKPNNIFLKKEGDFSLIKLGDFGCATYIKDNTSDAIGTIIYCAPEIVNNLKYDEKCDLWSLGVTLYELYFGKLPYGNNVTTNTIMEAIFNPEQYFNYKKTKINCLDYLFNRLLTIEPEKRMSYEEFFDLIFSGNFMNDNDMPKIKKLISEQIGEEDPNEDKENESFDEEKMGQIIVDKVVGFAKGNHFPDIMNFPNGSTNGELKYNNIIYYDENINFKNNIYRDSDIFERYTPGTFILCTDKDSLNMVKEEILRQLKKDSRITFNLITTGSKFLEVMKIIEENKDFEKCIENYCIYCRYVEKYSYLKNNYPKLHDNIYNKTKQVIGFIKKYSSEKIKPYPFTKLITYEDYIKKYKDRHNKISQFYGDLTKESYKKYLESMEELVKEEEKSKELIKNQKTILKGFLSFDIKEDIDTLDKLIIKEYTKNTFYGDLNKWLMNSKMNFYGPIAYFTARLMFSLNSYAIKNKMFCNENKKVLYRGIKIPFTCLLPYIRANKKIIMLSSFTSTSEKQSFAEGWSGRKISKKLYENSLKFSVVYYITNNYKSNWISNGINVQNVSLFKKEKEILYQPFSFYFVRDVQIDYTNYTADIYLETIGKTEILEEKIRQGMKIEYNKDQNIVQIRNS